MSISLDRILYGNLRSTDQNGNSLAVMGLSDGLTVQDGILWRGLTSLHPLPGNTLAATRAFGLFAGPGDRYVFACAFFQDGDSSLPLSEFVLVSRDLLMTLAGNLQPFVDLFSNPVSRSETLSSQVEPVSIPDPTPWTPTDRRAALLALLDNNPEQMPRAFSLLSAALHERGLLIYGYPSDGEARVRMVQGLLALLPPRTRPDLTFSTNRHERTSTHARVVFAQRSVSSGRWIADWETQTFPPDEAITSLYVRRLMALWNGDVDALLAHVDDMDSIAATVAVDKSLQTTLTAIAERHALDAQVTAGEVLPIDAVRSVLKDAAPTGTLKRLYATQLMRHALESRDTEAAVTLATLMDADPELDVALEPILDEMLGTEPDAVYAFIRARLSAGIDERWLSRLRAAALASLQIAITDGDSETVLSWLRLVAREPASYNLSEFVHNGLLAAQERARTDPELARGLIVLAMRRDPAAAQILTEDAALMAIIPNNLGTALRDYTGDPAALLEAHGIETLLSVLARAAQAHQPALFTPLAVEQTWVVFTGAQPVSALVRPAADQIITLWRTEGADWLYADAIETLLTLALRDRRDDLFHQLLHPLAKRDDFGTLLGHALHASERSVNDVLALIGQIVAVGDLTQQGAVDLYIQLLDLSEWNRDDLPMMAQLARTVQQVPTIVVPDDVLWQLLNIAAETKEELIARVVVRRVTAELDTIEDDAVLTEELQLLIGATQWSQHLRGQILTWWRGFTRAQSQTRLQRLEKAFEGKRALDDLRPVIQSLLAFRKMVGKRPLGQFAEDVGVAFTVLQALAESYDPSTRRASGFDAATIRAEFDARREELSPHELKILANNLKELAQLVGTMGDNRTKANLMRRGDDIDRQLITGDQPPHSAVDALKWMSGYLSGMHEKADEGEE